jgi:WD40 repeat protein
MAAVLLGLPGVAFSPDGALLATVSDDKVARLWNVGSGQTTRTFIGHSEGLRGVAFSPDGALLATCFRRRDKGSVPGWPGGE